MEIQDRQVDGIVVLSPNGTIDAASAPKLSELVQAHIAKGDVKLVIDLNGVAYTSSAGLRVLLSAVKETRAQNGDMRVAGVQPEVFKVLSLSGFTNILKLFDTADLAVASFS